jgi:hypothetical protein
MSLLSTQLSATEGCFFSEPHTDKTRQLGNNLSHVDLNELGIAANINDLGNYDWIHKKTRGDVVLVFRGEGLCYACNKCICAECCCSQWLILTSGRWVLVLFMLLYYMCSDRVMPATNASAQNAAAANGSF